MKFNMKILNEKGTSNWNKLSMWLKRIIKTCSLCGHIYLSAILIVISHDREFKIKKIKILYFWTIVTIVVLPKLHNSWPGDHKYYNFGIIFKIMQSVYPQVCVSRDDDFLILNVFYYMAISVLWFHDVSASGPKPLTKGKCISCFFIESIVMHSGNLLREFISTVEVEKNF